MIRCQNAFTFKRFAPFLIVVRIKEPSRGPWMEPTAPKRLVPPMTDEAIASNSHPSRLGGKPDPDAHGQHNADESSADCREYIGDVDRASGVDA